MRSENPYEPPPSSELEVSSSWSGWRNTFAAVAVLCVTYGWLFTKLGYRTFSRIPPLFEPSIPMMGIGIGFVPFFCLPLLLIMLVLTLQSKPRPYNAIIFYGLQFAVFVINIAFYGHGMRWCFAMLLSSILLVVEIRYRQLPNLQRLVGAGSLLVTAGWYFATVCICASASV